MVKICPKCEMKNSNNSYFCINCSTSLENVSIIEDKVFDSNIDNHYNLKSLDFQDVTNIWRPFAILGIFFAVISFFFDIVFIFKFCAIFLGGIAIVRGEKLGFIPIIISIFTFSLFYLF